MRRVAETVAMALVAICVVYTCERLVAEGERMARATIANRTLLRELLAELRRGRLAEAPSGIASGAVPAEEE